MLNTPAFVLKKRFGFWISALFLFYAIIALPSAPLAASELVLTPTLPKPGAGLTALYKPDSLYAQTAATAKTLYLLLYVFSEQRSQPTALYAPLQRQADGAYGAALQLRPEDVYGMAKITDGRKEDRNGNEFWEIFVSRDGSTPVEGAYLRASMTFMGGTPEAYARTLNLRKALELARKELEAYPNNLQAKIAVASLAFELKELDEKSHRVLVQQILSSPFDTTKEHYARALARLLNMQGKTSEAQKLEQSFIKRFPASELAAEKLLRNTAEAPGAVQFMPLALGYMRRFPATYSAAEMQGHIAQMYLAMDKPDTALAFIESQQYPSVYGYSELLRYYLRQDSTGQKRGLQLAQKALQVAYNPPLVHKPPFVTDFEWQSSTTSFVTLARSGKASLLFQMNRDDEALAEFRTILQETGGSGNRDAFLQMIAILKRRNQTREAFALASQATIALPKSREIAAQHKELFDTLQPKASESAYEKDYKKLQDSARSIAMTKLAATRLDLPAIEGGITQLDGKRVSFSEMRGKPVVVYFWASWCEPCTSALKYLQFLHRQFYSTTIFIVVNVWEETGKDRLKIVREIAQREKYTLPLCLDPTDDLVKTFGVTGLPTIFFLDKEGKIQFKELGAGDPNDLKESIERALGVLLSEKFYQKTPLKN